VLMVPHTEHRGGGGIRGEKEKLILSGTKRKLKERTGLEKGRRVTPVEKVVWWKQVTPGWGGVAKKK